MKVVFLILLLCSAYGCSSGFGNKLKSEKLDVYYDDDSLASLADSLGGFWTKKELVGDRKQSIKLMKVNGRFNVLIIKSEEFESEELSPQEIQLLKDLRKEMQDSVFQNKRTSIVICNEEFESLLEIKE